MLALKVMLGVYAAATLAAVMAALVAPRLQRWLIKHGATDMQWLTLGREPRGFRQFRDELRDSKPDKS